ncbi:helix-turn-helix domain-containing protein [Streptomyces sp. R302]|nr:helix-turn-helix domain-containing protein [Streptomyces sp. R301]NML80649.1 helix-turn-helix domain-containing protein [Streptomyces sp. R302]
MSVDPKRDPREVALFRAVQELLEGGPELPAPAERSRLREAAGVTQAVLARALETSTQTVKNWEAGRSDPRPPRRDPYLALLQGWAKKYPAFTPAPAPVSRTQPPPAADSPAPAPVPAPAPEPASAPAGARPRPSKARPASAPKRPAARKTAATKTSTAALDARFANGPLAVVEADTTGGLLAYCVDGLVLDVPARTLPDLVEWTLTEARLGAARLDSWGRDADPVLALTPAALEYFGLPAELSEDEQAAGRLPGDHPVLEQLAGAQWQLTRRGFGPWARIYRPAQGGRRSCVQLCVPSWRALDTRSWGDAAGLPPAELARTLGLYARRVMTPRGSTAVTGLELMTALHPPTRASEPDAEGRRHSVHNPGSLGKEPVDPAPCEAIDGHPVLADLPRFHVRGPAVSYPSSCNISGALTWCAAD